MQSHILVKTLYDFACILDNVRIEMMINIRKLENELWEAADALRAGSKLTSNQYCMPVLGLLTLCV